MTIASSGIVGTLSVLITLALREYYIVKQEPAVKPLCIFFGRTYVGASTFSFMSLFTSLKFCQRLENQDWVHNMMQGLALRCSVEIKI